MNRTTNQQAQAITARGNILVVAGAGTGKTSTLVQRCLAILEAGGSLENILMVTFTEAAAVEMRGRLRDALQAALTRLELDGSGDRGEHFRKQLALLDSAWISTLHGFCLQLVREHFYELGIDPDLSVLDEQQIQPVIRQLLDTMFERHYSDTTATAHAVQQLVRRAGRGADDRIRALILKLHRYSQSLATPEQWLESQRAHFSQPEPLEWRAWLAAGIRAWSAQWQPRIGSFPDIRALEIASFELRRLAGEMEWGAISAALHAIAAAESESKNWPRGTKTTVRASLKRFFDDLDFLRSLLPQNASDPLVEDWEWVRHELHTLLYLTREFTECFSRAKRDLGGLDFADLEQFALRVLRDPQTGQASAAARQWQRQFEHVFVDEYQDINAAQDAIITALSREGAEANRFLVGDVKQSIYRFRLANPAIFRGYEVRWSGGEAGSQRLALTENFRSCQGILDFINPFFRALMRESLGGLAYEELVFGDPVGRRDLAAKPGSGPRVEFHLIAKTDSADIENESDSAAENSDVGDLLAVEREARLVGLRLRELKTAGHEIWDKAARRFRPVQWRDMAVLLRSPASRVEAFAKEFASLEIPLEAARGGFFESTEISDLISLLKLLDNSLQDVPLLAVLRSPLVGMSLRELAEIRAGENSESRAKFFWLAARQFHQRGDRSSSAWQKLDHIFRQLERWRELARQGSLSHCLEAALVETHYEILLRAEPRGEQRLANVRRLLELARDYDPYQRQGLFRFLRFIQAQEESPVELEPLASSHDAVQLTSIHRSKGLEFPVVAIAGLGGQFNLRDLREDILLDEQYGLCSRVTPPGSDRSYPSLPFWLARQRQQRELLGEELRLLYVAMTRARDTLILTAASGKKGIAEWSATQTRELSDHELLAARSYLDWLRLWLPLITKDEDWIDDREGRSALLSWMIYDENDPRLGVKAIAESEGSVDVSVNAIPESDLPLVRQRLAWKYGAGSATRQRAKTSVTELRRERADEEAEPAPFARHSDFRLGAKSAKLSAAEIGVAHHRFLQRISLAALESSANLRAEADRLAHAGWLSAAEVAALDFGALTAFWETDFGRKVQANTACVQRELEFTAGLKPADLMALGLHPQSELAADEVVVVQGVVDLAVILRNEIWIIDFKTDAVSNAVLPEKVKTYEPQLRLYALALERIYRRPVTECALYFLANQTLTSVLPVAG